jgi:hypothetical protein
MSKPGTFRWEDDLRESFRKNALPNFWKNRRQSSSVATLDESTCSDGRADLVSASLPEGTLEGRLGEWCSLITRPTCSRVLACFPRNSVRTERFLLRRLGVSVEGLRRALREMLHAGLLRDLGGGRYRLDDDFVLPNIEITSFEFKLSNWRRALYQATRYRVFSHRVYVVLPAESTRAAAENSNLFAGLNIGLIAHSSDGNCHQLVRPRKREPIARHRMIMAIGALIGTALPSKKGDPPALPGWQ